MIFVALKTALVNFGLGASLVSVTRESCAIDVTDKQRQKKQSDNIFFIISDFIFVTLIFSDVFLKNY